MVQVFDRPPELPEIPAIPEMPEDIEEIPEISANPPSPAAAPAPPAPGAAPPLHSSAHFLGGHHAHVQLCYHGGVQGCGRGHG